ncbi:hypothetical protein CJ20_259 [Escherichia phage CJ20]|nr:hypothetical protein CJ20_259 [Escherichia phage CJ20]
MYNQMVMRHNDSILSYQIKTENKMLELIKAAGEKGLMVNTRDPEQRQAFGELKAKGLVKASLGIGNALRVTLTPAGKAMFFPKPLPKRRRK